MPAPAKADLTKRAVAALIDGVIAGLLSLLPSVLGPLAAAAYVLARDGLDVEFMRYRSIGKQVMDLRVVRLDGGAMELETSIRRNLPLAAGTLIGLIPWVGWFLGPLVGLIVTIAAIVLVVTGARGRRLGDRWAGTQVIEEDDPYDHRAEID